MSDDFLGGIGAAIVRIFILPPALTIAVDAVAQLRASAVLANGSSVDISEFVAWRSSNNAVAQVSDSGQLTAIDGGTAAITASYVGLTGSMDVTVTGDATDFFLVFDYVIQAEDGESFIVTLPVAQPTTDYSVDGVVVDGQGEAPVFDFPEADRQETQFRVRLTGSLATGSVVQFTVARG